MELIQIDSFHAKIAQAHFQLLPQVFGTSDRCPAVRALTGQPAFGRDRHSLGIRGLSARVAVARICRASVQVPKAFADFWALLSNKSSAS
jgi:hypothetical protein